MAAAVAMGRQRHSGEGMVMARTWSGFETPRGLQERLGPPQPCQAGFKETYFHGGKMVTQNHITYGEAVARSLYKQARLTSVRKEG